MIDDLPRAILFASFVCCIKLIVWECCVCGSWWLIDGEITIDSCAGPDFGPEPDTRVSQFGIFNWARHTCMSQFGIFTNFHLSQTGFDWSDIRWRNLHRLAPHCLCLTPMLVLRVYSNVHVGRSCTLTHSCSQILVSSKIQDCSQLQDCSHLQDSSQLQGCSLTVFGGIGLVLMLPSAQYAHTVQNTWSSRVLFVPLVLLVQLIVLQWWDRLLLAAALSASAFPSPSPFPLAQPPSPSLLLPVEPLNQQ